MLDDGVYVGCGLEEFNTIVTIVDVGVIVADGLTLGVGVDDKL